MWPKTVELYAADEYVVKIRDKEIRTTLQALIAIYDNCNSLHTNAYEEAITTPTEESVRRAMETGFQRGKIQEESLYYEHKKHDGSYPIIGVNTFLNPKGMAQQEIELARSSEDEKQGQITTALYDVGGQYRRSM